MEIINDHNKKTKKCIKCGEPCHKSLCRNCFENKKTKHKGQIARLKNGK